MLTQCPNCRQWFHIEPGQVDAAEGQARCGDCDTVFDARASLRETPEAGERDVAADAIPSADSPMPTGEEVVSLAIQASGHRRERWTKALWVAALSLAALVLIAQLVHVNRYALARAAVVGPPLTALYRALGLELGPRLELARYAIVAAALEASHARRSVLVLHGRIVNRAPFVQRLPLVRISLRDLGGHVVGSRLLLPSDYGAATINSLAAGQAFDFRARIADPGVAAAGFDLVLCKRRAGEVICRRS